MADLLVPDGDTDNPVRPTGARPWDRAASERDAPSRGGVPEPAWEPRTTAADQYPTRMARRRALAHGDVQDGWQPDVVLTPALLARVGEELRNLFAEDEDTGPRARIGAADETGGPRTAVADGAHAAGAGEPDGPHAAGAREPDSADGTAGGPSARVASTLAGVPAPGGGLVPEQDRGGRHADREAPGRRHRGWFRRRHADDAETAGRPSRRRGAVDDDPRSDEAWFADLRQLTDAEEPRGDAPAADLQTLDVPIVPAAPGRPVPADRVVPAEPAAAADRAAPVDQLRPALPAGRPRRGRHAEPERAPEHDGRETGPGRPEHMVPERGGDQGPARDPGSAPRPQDAPAEVASGSAAPVAEVRPVLPTSRRLGRPWVRLLAGVVAVVIVAVAVVVVVQRRGGDGSPPAGGGVAAPTEHAITLALATSSGDVTGLSLLAAGAGDAQQVLVPSRLLLDVPRAGRIALTGSLVPGPEAPGQALADALGVRIDATWALSTAALAALVDKVGGVVVNVDTDITRGTAPGAEVLIGAGPNQKLNGEQAARFAQFLGAGEPEAARLARQEQVVRATLGALPAGVDAVRSAISALPGAPTGEALKSVVTVVSGIGTAGASDQLASTVLPVKDIDAGGAVVSYGLDSAAAAAMVDSRLRGVRLPVPPGGVVRVLVQNGVGTPGLSEDARARLLAANLRYVAGGNLPGFGQKTTVVLLRDASAQNRDRGAAVAKALGLSESSLRISESAPTVAEVVVILGADFRPR